MRTNRSRGFLGLALVLALTVAASVQLNGGEPRRVAKQVTGKIKTLDLEQGVITLLHGDDDDPPVEVKYSLASKEIPLTTDFGEKPALNQVKPGQGVQLGLSADDDVVHINVMSPQDIGRIKSIDAEQKTVTLLSRSDNVEHSYRMNPGAKILLDRDVLQPSDVYYGMRATLVLSLDQTTVHQIQVSLKADPSAVQGALIKADPATQTIQVLVGSAGRYNLRTFPVAKDFRFGFQRKLHKLGLGDLAGAVSIEAVPRALPVWLQLDAQRRQVVALVASSPVLEGPVQGVDANRGQITIGTPSGPEKFSVHQDADINLQNRPHKLAEIQPGTLVALHLGLNRTEVIAIRPARVADDED